MPMNPRLLVPRAAGSFDPRKISGLEVWLDAADTTTITLNSGNVSQWNDKSGKGRNFTQGTAIKQPAYSSSLFAKGGLHFDGSDDVMSNQTAGNWGWTHRDSVTWAAVYHVGTAGVKSSIFAAFMGTVDPFIVASPVGMWIALEDRSANSERSQYTVHNTANANVINRLYANTTSFPFGINTIFTVRATLTGSKSAEWRTNGGASQTFQDQTQSPQLDGATGNPAFGLSIGATSHTGYGGQRFGPWRIAEMIGWSRSLTDSELQAAYRYLGRKWGITVA